ncbi:hypothetical protein lbkm_1260 [Lachnospiraceae bacterium KM106-2]|nr:hypothetical protein lbkm_1260 [Lachnospiraceae bacterium KM106-2]
MGNEHGEWKIIGTTENSSDCIKSVDDLVEYINEIGFVPLFKNEIPGFSVEEHTIPDYWWSGDKERDPWEWREIIAANAEIAYGKFFRKKAGFISKNWFPHFANFRRDGYDFDSRYEDGLASHRSKRIMDLFETNEEMFSHIAKKQAGFGKGGEKNFDGVVTSLQMETYLIVTDFQQKKNKAGKPYGWAAAIYTTPENQWGYDFVTEEYRKSPEESREKIVSYLKERYPMATEKQIGRIVG